MVKGREVFDPIAAARSIEKRLGTRPRAAVVLGSGLGGLAGALEGSVSIRFDEVPGLPPVTVPGHAGRFLAGEIGGVSVLLQAGRYHVYEGHPMDVVVGPVRLAIHLGIEALVLTNAAGGVRPDLSSGDLMLIDDHLNLMGENPLVGPPHAAEARFPDMSEPYDAGLRTVLLSAARDAGAPLARGVYGAVLGPSFETAAEVRALARLGVDAVGMSTVPEVIAARARKVPCVAVSMITNRATGLSEGPHDHTEVLAVAKAAGKKLEAVLVAFFERFDTWRQSTATR